MYNLVTYISYCLAIVEKAGNIRYKNILSHSLELLLWLCSKIENHVRAVI